MPERGELVRVVDHYLEGYAWTVGKVGCVLRPARVRDFAIWAGMRAKDVERPPVREGWWVVSVDSPKRKGGYAYATLPEEVLAPHGCAGMGRCPKVHPCLKGT